MINCIRCGLDFFSKEKCPFCPPLRFTYSKYWRRWSRMLRYRNGEYLEVNLEPVNPNFPRAWENDVQPIIVRAHSTKKVAGEGPFPTLPIDVALRMCDKLGTRLAYRILSDDLLSEIDETLLRLRMQGGGVPIANLIKGRTFSLTWLDGKVESVKGIGESQEEALKDAMVKAGYGAGAIRALDHWKEISA